MDNFKEIKQAIKDSKKIVIFTGAGISVASGIPDFRSADGLYNQKSGLKATPEQIISHTFFKLYPSEFYKFYKDKMIYPHATPNEAHLFFSNLERNKEVTIITQNIDGLHQMAGSSNVLELHGSVKRNYCQKCSKFYSLQNILKEPLIPRCDCGGIIKPDVVLYEESLNLKTLEQSINKIIEADLLIVVGTSLIVQPAASLIRYFKGDNLILINKEKTPYDKYATIVINDDIIKVVNELKSYYF